MEAKDQERGDGGMWSFRWRRDGPHCIPDSTSKLAGESVADDAFLSFWMRGSGMDAQCSLRAFTAAAHQITRCLASPLAAFAACTRPALGQADPPLVRLWLGHRLGLRALTREWTTEMFCSSGLCNAHASNPGTCGGADRRFHPPLTTVHAGVDRWLLVGGTVTPLRWNALGLPDSAGLCLNADGSLEQRRGSSARSDGDFGLDAELKFFLAGKR